MAVWSYTPQDLLPEPLTVETSVTQVSPASAVTGRHTANTVRGWRLRYSIRDQTEVGSMLAFYTSMDGPLRAFDFWHPLEQRLIKARFDSSMTVELFQPRLGRVGEL